MSLVLSPASAAVVPGCLDLIGVGIIKYDRAFVSWYWGGVRNSLPVTGLGQGWLGGQIFVHLPPSKLWILILSTPSRFQDFA